MTTSARSSQGLKFIRQWTEVTAGHRVVAALVIAWLSAAAAFGQDLRDVVSGETKPLAMKLKNLGPEWRRFVVHGASSAGGNVSVNVTGNSSGATSQNNLVGAFGPSRAYVTQGEVIARGPQRYLVAYRLPAGGLDLGALLQAAVTKSPASIAKPGPDSEVYLSLLELSTVGSLQEIRPFDLGEELAESERAAQLLAQLGKDETDKSTNQRRSGTTNSPADHLPGHIKRMTWFGERADWSPDGKRILFLEKTFGDVYEVEVATAIIRPLTHHFPHHGYTRALYLASGDILLSGPERMDPAQPGDSRTQCWLSVLSKDLTQPPVPLGTKCSEGPAVSRTRPHIAWTHVSAQYPEEMERGDSRIQEADIVYEGGRPRLANQRLVLHSRDLAFKCTLETQSFVPPGETRLTFSAYGYQGTEVCVLDLNTKEVTNLTNSADEYDEPEGIFPDGKHTLVECDRQNRQGPGHVDIWKLPLDGGPYKTRLTYFSDVPGFKASNPVVSDDGRWMAFQMAKSKDAAGVGYGVFVMDLRAVKEDSGG
ncbi:MAG: hypothetical protein U1G07_18265 [Verrucomicrobiota bacterium]